ncbi:MAG: chorismate mutase [Pseudobdellovibrio sp.]
MKTEQKIKTYRLQLNSIDQELFLLCKKRILIAKKIVKLKQENNIEICDLARENKIENIFYKKVMKLTSKKRVKAFIKSLFELNPYYPIKNKS